MLRFSLPLLIIVVSTLAGHYPVDNEPKVEILKANEGRIEGSVTIPTEAKQQRIFRGRVYRNRQNTTNETGSSAEDQKTQNYLNTIISVHPTSFKAELPPTLPNQKIWQKEAEFIPQVTVVTIGSTVEFVNDDPFFHNVFSLTKGARFNIGRRPKGDIYPVEIPSTKWKIEGIGQISLFCDIHSQMNAVIISLDTPYFTRVSEDGTFSLDNLPEGSYQLRMYNPKFDVVSEEIVVTTNSQNKDLSF